tara:strand:- start:424 stop:864 length:441 start_codon:yes stop_codon:yes gene_type:complete
MINKNDLFNLFPQPEDRGRVDITDDEIEIEVSSSSHFKIGKFKKLIENHQLFFEHFKRGMEEANAKNIDHEETKRQASFIVYNRAWYYIKGINLNEKEDVLDLTLFNPYDLAYTLQLAIKFHESVEEYEKCAHLFKIQQFLENWLK